MSADTCWNVARGSEFQLKFRKSTISHLASEGIVVTMPTPYVFNVRVLFDGKLAIISDSKLFEYYFSTTKN